MKFYEWLASQVGQTWTEQDVSRILTHIAEVERTYAAILAVRQGAQ